MGEGLPPLRNTPHLDRLLWPGEEVIYTPGVHLLEGWPWLLGTLFFFVLLKLTPWFAVGVAVCGIVWVVPFMTNELAVTTHRFLYRIGRDRLTVGDVEPYKLVGMELDQNPLTNLLNTGKVRINVRSGNAVEGVVLPYVRHPYTLMEALETLEYKRTQA